MSRVAQKVGEEDVEVVITTHQSQQQELIEERSDLLFHLLVLLQQKGITLTEVVAELVERNRAGHSERVWRT